MERHDDDVGGGAEHKHARWWVESGNDPGAYVFPEVIEFVPPEPTEGS